MKRTLWLLTFCMVLAQVPLARAADRFDGDWLTKLSCPAKQMTEGYTWHFLSVVKDSLLRGEHGKAGEPGYLLLEGKIAADGSATLQGTGIVASRKYAKGLFAAEGQNYSYEVKAQFGEDTGTGLKSGGLGLVGRACTFDFVKQVPGTAATPPG